MDERLIKVAGLLNEADKLTREIFMEINMNGRDRFTCQCLTFIRGNISSANEAIEDMKRNILCEEVKIN